MSKPRETQQQGVWAQNQDLPEAPMTIGQGEGRTRRQGDKETGRGGAKIAQSFTAGMRTKIAQPFTAGTM